MALSGLTGSDSGADSHLMQDEEKADKEERNGHSKYDLKLDVEIKKKNRHSNRRLKTYGISGKRCCIGIICALFFLALCSAVTVMIVYLLQESHIQVILPIGVVKGRIVDSPQGERVEEFLGIPFAHPPIGALRYADPVPLNVLPSEPYEAFDHKYSCMQYKDTTFGDFPGSDMWNAPNEVREDCLYMNIWVPTKKSSEKRKAVLVWIYGGGFMAGSNALWVYDGKALSTHGDAIVVTFNYRVGTFGYLSTGDGRIKGNFGMKDQVLALEWVNNYIYNFGGDPDRITIFGESSGASSAGLHMMSSMSQHLFHRAIFESGSPDSHWSFMSRDQAKERSQIFFRNVNCTMDETEALMNCLRSRDADTLLNNEWVDSHFMVFPWAPNVDGEFLEDTPYNLLQRGEYEPKPSILGVNRDEGSYWNLYALEGFNKATDSLHDFESFRRAVETIAWDLSTRTRNELITLYADYEIKNISNKAANRDALDKVSGDRSFTCPTKELASIFTQAEVTTYMYYLTYRASNEVWPDWMGVIHGAEIQWIFGMPMQKSRGYTKEEVQFSKNIMEYWSNFAKTGNPNEESLAEWPEYSTGQYLEWRRPGSLVVNETSTLRSRFCELWNDINRKLNRGEFV